MGFKPCDADPCLSKGGNDGESIFVGLYVDDDLTVGGHKVKEVVEKIRKEFEIQDDRALEDGKITSSSAWRNVNCG